MLVAMGRRAKALEALLGTAGIDVHGPARSFRLSDLPADRLATARAIFDTLGGTGFARVSGPGAWDITAADGLVVELDEEQHFNRYRAATLPHLAPLSLPWAAPYLDYCASREHRCGANRGWWSNPSAERIFGESARPGVFDGNGSARWKQRAFNDACKDLHPSVRLSRVSIYDEVNGRSLGAILRASDLALAPAVRDHVMSRVKHVRV